jgi:hypothetical protein
MTTTHVVHLTQAEWDAINEGRQTFVVQHGGAQFQKGDNLALERRDIMLDAAELATAAARAYRRTLFVVVRHVMMDAEVGIERGYVVLGVDLASESIAAERSKASSLDAAEKAKVEAAEPAEVARDETRHTVAVTTDG